MDALVNVFEEKESLQFLWVLVWCLLYPVTYGVHRKEHIYNHIGQEPAPCKCVLVSTSEVVRKDMRDWALTDEGEKWAVKLDDRDLGGHQGTTFRGWSATLASQVWLVIPRMVLIFVLPLDVHGRLRVFGQCLTLVLRMVLRTPF